MNPVIHNFNVLSKKDIAGQAENKHLEIFEKENTNLLKIVNNSRSEEIKVSIQDENSLKRKNDNAELPVKKELKKRGRKKKLIK